MDLFKKWVKKLRINPLWDVQLELGIRLVILNCFEDGNGTMSRKRTHKIDKF